MFKYDSNYLFYADGTLLSQEEKTFLVSKTNTFYSNTSLSDPNNFYYRQFIESGSDKASLSTFISKIYNLLVSSFYYPSVEENGIWINKIDALDEQSEIFHRDKYRFSSVTFLNVCWSKSKGYKPLMSASVAS